MKKTLMIIFLLLSVIMSAGEKIKLVTGEYEPYTTEKVKEKGFFTEIVSAVFKEMGMEPEYVFMPWKRCESEVLNGEAFAAFPYYPSEERKKIYNFSDVVTNTAGRLFYIKSKFNKKLNWETYGDLKEYKLGGTLGYWYEKPFKEAGLNVDYAPNDEQSIKKLYTNRINVLATEELVGWEIIKKIYPKDIEKFDTMAKTLNVGELRVMISRKYPNGAEIEAKFGVALKKIKENGVYAAILKKYNVK